MRYEGFRYPFRWAGLTDVGRRRESNQDEAILSPEYGCFGVSDGMGGLAEGAAAADYVKQGVISLSQVLSGQWRQQTPTPEQAAETWQDCAALLSDRLYQQGNTPRFYRYGATLAAVQLWQDRALFFWLGDSRGYVLRRYKKRMEKLTEDMNLAGELVRAGELTPEEALHSPYSARLTAFVGMQSPATPAVKVTALGPGDRVLLCSDGLYGMVSEPDMARILRSSRSPERVCQRLVDRANANGGRDNISAVYIRIYSE